MVTVVSGVRQTISAATLSPALLRATALKVRGTPCSRNRLRGTRDSGGVIARLRLPCQEAPGDRAPRQSEALRA
jgi:hypothetical protein